MRLRVIAVVLMTVAVALLLWIGLFLLFGGLNTQQPASAPPPSSSPAPHPSPPSPQPNGSIDPTVLAALLGLIGVVVAALIAGGFSLYQARYNAKLERDNALLQDQIATARAAQEREQQRRETEAEVARTAKLRAQTLEERVQAYRSTVRVDPRIAHMQILTMSRPLELTTIYVRIRLHQEARAGYELDPILLLAEAQRDPNALLRAGRKRLESLLSTALDSGEAIYTYKHCVIMGDPGAGKTTLLKYLTLKALDGQLPGLPDLPIHLELNTFVSSQCPDLLDFAATSWETRYDFPKAEARSYMEEQLKAGKALLLLDALDEAMIGETAEVAEALYRRTAEAIMQLVTRYHQSPIVVTARKASYLQRPFLAGFTELEVVDFRPEDITQFVDKWFASYPSPQKQINAVDLNARLERNPRIQALAANPLLLSLIVLVYEAQLDLPDRRAELYRQCVETLLTKWDASRDIRRRRQFKPEHKRQLLEEIAWYFHLQGQRYFPEHELQAVIADFLPAVGLPKELADGVLQEIAAENGLLEEQARGWHGFLHVTLQEYFVAQYAIEHHQLEKLLEYRGDPWWEEVILLYAGGTPDASLLLQKLLGQDSKAALREDIFLTNLVLAGHCLAAHPTVRQASLREEVVLRLFSTLKQTPYAFMSERIADALSEIGGEKVNAHLLDLLADPAVDPTVRASIATALGALGERAVVPKLVDLLADPAVDPTVRASIATALGALGDHSVVQGLHHLLDDPQYDLFVKVHMATTLDKLGDHSVVPGLLQVLTNAQGDPALRIHIATYLNTIGERSAAPVLLRILSDAQTNPAVSESIATTLGALGDQSVIPELLQLLSPFQSKPNVQMHIAIALGTLGEHSVIPRLLQWLSHPQISLSAGLNIAATLGTLNERSVVPELLRLLSKPQIDPIVQTGIVKALGQLANDEATLQVLTTLLPDSAIADDIYRALWHISRRIGVRICTADDPSTKDFTIIKLGESGKGKDTFPRPGF